MSIDVDGGDIDHFSALDRLPSPPRLVVVEVQPEHGRFAKQNIGQPLAVFMRKARELGYRLVYYLGCNAFFLLEEAGWHDALPTLSPEIAWAQCMRVHKGNSLGAEYLYRRNQGMADSLYRFENPLLTAEYLGIAPARAARLQRKGRIWRFKRQALAPGKGLMGLR